MSLPLDVTSGPFAETAVVSTLTRLVICAPHELIAAHRRTSAASRTGPADFEGRTPQDLPRAIRVGVDVSRCGRDESVLQAIPRHRLGDGRFGGLRLLCGRPCKSSSTCICEKCVTLRFSNIMMGLQLLSASSPLYYITALTALFESIAMIVDQHQPVVEKYYGPGKMANVLKRLLEESDRVANTLIEGWEEERSMKRKVRVKCQSDMSTYCSSSSLRYRTLTSRRWALPRRYGGLHRTRVAWKKTVLILGRLTKYLRKSRVWQDAGVCSVSSCTTDSR